MSNTKQPNTDTVDTTVKCECGRVIYKAELCICKKREDKFGYEQPKQGEGASAGKTGS